MRAISQILFDSFKPLYIWGVKLFLLQPQTKLHQFHPQKTGFITTARLLQVDNNMNELLSKPVKS